MQEANFKWQEDKSYQMQIYLASIHSQHIAHKGIASSTTKNQGDKYFPLKQFGFLCTSFRPSQTIRKAWKGELFTKQY